MSEMQKKLVVSDTDFHANMNTNNLNIFTTSLDQVQNVNMNNTPPENFADKEETMG